MFTEKFIKTKNGLTIFSESIGDKKNSSIILIMGALNQGLFWYDSFCKSLSEHDFFVIRFDHRDTGFSSIINYKESPYTLNDLMEDVIDIMKAYNISKTHFIGLSMGGYICQLLGVHHPENVQTLTLISTTVDQRPYMDSTMGIFNNKYDLPFPEKRFLDFIEKNKINPPQNELDIFENQIEGWKIIFENINVEDFNEIIKLIKLSNNRNINKYSAYNHGLAVFNSEERSNILKKIKAPTYIFHGENDPCFPVKHGLLLNKLISNSKLEIIKNMGHMFSVTESFYLSEKIIENIKEHV